MGAVGFRNPDAQKRVTEEKKHGGKNKREKDTDRPVPVNHSGSHRGKKQEDIHL